MPTRRSTPPFHGGLCPFGEGGPADGRDPVQVFLSAVRSQNSGGSGRRGRERPLSRLRRDHHRADGTGRPRHRPRTIPHPQGDRRRRYGQSLPRQTDHPWSPGRPESPLARPLSQRGVRLDLPAGNAGAGFDHPSQHRLRDRRGQRPRQLLSCDGVHRRTRSRVHPRKTQTAPRRGSPAHRARRCRRHAARLEESSRATS